MDSNPDVRSMLFGVDETPSLCGVAITSTGVKCWFRKDGNLSGLDETVAPVFLLSHRELLDGFKPEPQIAELSGDNYYRFSVTCENWAHQDSALKHLRELYRQQRNDFEHEPYLRLGDNLTQYLLQSGRTHFGGMALGDLKLLYLSLRAKTGGADYSDPAEEGDEIVMLGLGDGKNYEQVFVTSGSERALLEKAVATIAEFDPDVVVGHNLFKGSFAYLVARCKRHRIKLDLGRDGSVVKVRKSRAPAAEKQLEYPRPDVAGRQMVDTWFLAQYYDIVKRDLESFDAPYVAGYLDKTCQLPDPVDPWAVDRLLAENPEVLEADLRYELQAAATIFNTLAGSYFAQAQMLPLSFQDSVVRGNGMKINYLLLREYLRRFESIPEPAEGRFIVGGFTDIRKTGLIADVLNVDMASLYPSIMLKHGVKPGADTGNVFQPMLKQLTDQRLAAKKIARESTDPSERTTADARQAAFKIFINSFFGYLGTNRMNWGDAAQAEFITTTGQKYVQLLAKLVEGQGGEVIEIDTDGVYFTAPEGFLVQSEAARDELVGVLNKGLPEGIVVELGGYFPAMLSHKIKNYALLNEDGSITVKGSGMKSRGLEPFLHRFIADSIRLILLGQPERIANLYDGLKTKIAGGTISIRELAKTDNLIESLDTYQDKIAAGARNRAAAYEVALQARRPLRPGDQVAYYITGDKATVKAFEAAKPVRSFDPASPDYNTKYYVKKLDQNLKKVKGFMVKEDERGLFE